MLPFARRMLHFLAENLVLTVLTENANIPHFERRAHVKACREGGERLNRTNQANFLEFSQIALNV
jgi:hypothetical protein